ncbi:hypothetical protein B5X24_HaOG211209 [Helicoverpa armigera]|nr:hypothetical protein B5X24_HaOG211209 [Helicoverpa armigera]
MKSSTVFRKKCPSSHLYIFGRLTRSQKAESLTMLIKGQYTNNMHCGGTLKVLPQLLGTMSQAVATLKDIRQ